MDRLSPLDALFLHAEDGTTHMHIASCAIFEGPPPPFDDLVRLVESKLPLLTRYRQKVRFVPGGLGRPVWVDDPEFNLAYHVRHTALPAPGSEQDLENLMGRLMSQELDRDRPLWEAWVAEGLPDDRWAIISKVHHCMVDGISGTDLMTFLLDPDPESEHRPIEEWHPDPEPDDTTLVADALGDLVRSPYEQFRALRAATRTPRRLLSQAATVLDGLRSYGDRLITPATPLSIEGTIGPHRRWAAARSTLDEVREIKSALGGSVNDVVLAAITGAFREFLLGRGDDVRDAVLRSLVPVSVRTNGDHTANNQVTAMIAELPIGIDDPLDRLEAIREQMDRLKVSHQAEAGEAVASAAYLAPPLFLSLGVRAGTTLMRRMPQRSVNTVTTNVPGPQFPLYAAGREMLEYLPFVPLSQGVRVGIAILSYNGKLSFGVTGDYDTVADVHRMAELIESEMHALTKLAKNARGQEPPTRRKSGGRLSRNARTAS
jgi:diacylglycerol O-acyltransferase / wax synthase